MGRCFYLQFSQDQLRYGAKLAFEGKFFSVDNYFVKDIFTYISFKTNQIIRYLRYRFNMVINHIFREIFFLQNNYPHYKIFLQQRVWHHTEADPVKIPGQNSYWLRNNNSPCTRK